jgi:hypothetical protein
MLSRRTFLSIVAGSMAAPGLAFAQQGSQKVALYANVGSDLTHYDVNVAGAELIKRETVTLPAAVYQSLSPCHWAGSIPGPASLFTKHGQEAVREPLPSSKRGEPPRGRSPWSR